MNFKALFIAFFLVCQGSAYAQISFFSFGSTWKYKDDGSNQGTAWRATAFDDSGWSSGVGQLGFGDGDESTLLTSGYIGYYFRKTISIPDISQFQSFTFEMYRDDGVVIYVNGVEVIRDNMPAGTINYNTVALFASDDGQSKITYTIPASQFQSGVNAIAVEVHQESVGSSDISWDMQLSGLPLTLTPFFTVGSTWKYLDDGSDQGTSWSDPSFNDSGWQSGAGKFGYPQSNVTTLLNACGTPVPNPSCSNKYITYYFRKTVNIPSVSLYQSFTFQFNRDDGIIVYVNGAEVFRNNIAAGAIDYLTLAINSADNGNSTLEKSVPTSAFIDGDNTIAVEVHQTSGASSDVLFDMGLLGVKPGYVGLVLGHYLQKVTSTSAVLRWRTNAAADSKVQYGTSPDNLSQTATGSSSTTDHTIQLSGLTPYTKYYYNIGTSDLILEQDESNYFLTSPLPGATGKYTFWAIGDAGNNSSNQLNVRDSYKNYIGNKTTNGWLLLGDNAYEDGTEENYIDNFFNIYKGGIMRKAPLWPATGNHEYDNDTHRQKDQAISYFSFFDLPTNAEGGGIASGSEAYYSFDYGNIHFVSLDSYIIENNAYRLYDASSPQLQWLQTDLAANTKDWTVVFFHHPPYTMGSHNSDTETELVSIRQNVNPILEQYKVDLVLCGHSHDYERSGLMKGHFGLESTFSAATHYVSQSNGRYENVSTCAYVKNAPNYDGTVYVEAGSAGELEGVQSSYPHDAMQYSNYLLGGSFVVEVEENRLDGKWLASDGTILDKFTIMKNVNQVTNLTTDLNASMTLTSSWVGNYNWSNGATSRSITLPAATTGTYTVTDAYGCITDVFNITTAVPVELIAFSATASDDEVLLKWKTASEMNNDFFEVQRFTSSPEEITALGKVNGHGTTVEVHAYEFIDTSPLHGISYYRLKQVDYDRNCDFSNIVRVDFKGKKEIQLFPNPGNGTQLGLTMGDVEGAVFISVQNATGETVTAFSMEISSTTSPHAQLIKFDTPLSPGLYFIQVKSNSGMNTLKWIVK